jgi:tetraacyldisaccharide 4'-kinase
LPVLVIPVRVEFLNDGGQQFDQLIIDYVREHTTYNGLH